MQIPLGKLGPRQVLAANGLSEAEENIDAVRVLKIRVWLANCNFESHGACHNVTSPRCMLLISKALLILAKHKS